MGAKKVYNRQEYRKFIHYICTFLKPKRLGSVEVSIFYCIQTMLHIHKFVCLCVCFFFFYIDACIVTCVAKDAYSFSLNRGLASYSHTGMSWTYYKFQCWGETSSFLFVIQKAYVLTMEVICNVVMCLFILISVCYVTFCYVPACTYL